MLTATRSKDPVWGHCHCFQGKNLAVSLAMRRFVTKSTALTRAILLLSVCAVFFAGIPLTVVHSHADATFGHVHAISEHHHEHEHDDHHDDEGLDSGSLHVHALDILLPGIAATPELSVSPQRLDSLTLLPIDTWLPDKPVSPLFRPPIT